MENKKCVYCLKNKWIIESTDWFICMKCYDALLPGKKKENKCVTCWKNIHKFRFICEECYIKNWSPMPDRYKVIQEDNINTPHHYTQWWIEPIDYIIANDMNFLEGNCVKYVTRYKHKNWLEDLKKARFYIDKLIENYKWLD